MSENNIFEPLILSVGSHEAGSGKGCAMNVVSWIHGDETITDFPTCSDQGLASMVQALNDSCGTYAAMIRRDARGCDHPTTWESEDYDLLPEDAEMVIELGTATMGTGSETLTGEERQKGHLAALKVLSEAANHGRYGEYYQATELHDAIRDVAWKVGAATGTSDYAPKMAPIIAEAINAFKLAVAKPVVMPSRAEVQVAYEKMVAAAQ